MCVGRKWKVDVKLVGSSFVFSNQNKKAEERGCVCMCVFVCLCLFGCACTYRSVCMYTLARVIDLDNEIGRASCRERVSSPV